MDKDQLPILELRTADVLGTFIVSVCVCVCLSVYVCALSHFNHVWLCDPVDHSPPGSTVHGIFWARILQWAVVSSSRESSRPRDQTRTSCIAGRFFITWAIKEVPSLWIIIDKSIHNIKLHKSACFPVHFLWFRWSFFFPAGGAIWDGCGYNLELFLVSAWVPCPWTQRT